MNSIQIKIANTDNDFVGLTTQNNKMTITFPSIFSHNISTIKGRIEDIISLGYTKEETLNIIYELPALLGYSLDKIKTKINYLKEINLEQIVTTNTKQLIQSTELTYARYEYLKNEQNKTITMVDYTRLFVRDKQFEKQYNITKKELLEKYDYNKYMEEKNARTI